MNLRKCILPLALIVAVPGAASAQIQSKTQKPAVPLVFHVTGKSEAMPDIVQLHFAIVGDGETLTKAQEQLNQTEQAVAGTLAKYDIKRTQMHVGSYRMSPIQPNVVYEAAMDPSSLPSLGYRARREYTITPGMPVLSMAKLIQIEDAVLQQGARPSSQATGELGDPDSPGRGHGMLFEFVVSDTDVLLKGAVNDAMKRARGLAEEASKKMGTGTLHLVSLEVSDSKLSSLADLPIPGQGDPPAGMSALQPMSMEVAAEVGFSYD